jgi:hypothetical protein
LRRDALVEALAFDRNGDVAGGKRNAARVRVFASFDRIVVGARKETIPERPPASASAAGIT